MCKPRTWRSNLAEPSRNPFDLDAARGMLIGLAVGDAVGTTVEFAPRGSFPEVTDMVGGGPFHLAAGEWTDDTSMALCLADSLLDQQGWDAADCMHRFVRWRDTGYNSVTGTCFDIGLQTSAALDRFVQNGDPYAGPVEDRQSGNGGIMRLAPSVIAYGAEAQRARDHAKAQSCTTHGSPSCLKAVVEMTNMLLLGDHQTWPKPKLPPVEASGYVVHSMQAALWAIDQSTDFETAVLKAVNLGGDADTVGAIVGQLAGRLYGYTGIPQHWRARLAWHDTILAKADALWRLTPALPKGDTNG